MDLKELKALLRLMEGNDVEELEVEEGGRRIRIRRRSASPLTPPAAMAAASGVSASGAVTASISAPGASPDTTGLLAVESPMVGTFYRAPAPGAEPYVKEGDLVEKGTVLCVIEAMKLMNEVESDVKGRIAGIAAQNGQPVEFGQTLFLIEPA